MRIRIHEVKGMRIRNQNLKKIWESCGVICAPSINLKLLRKVLGKEHLLLFLLHLFPSHSEVHEQLC